MGSDGRNRTLLSPFDASSGRNTPSANQFIFGPCVWLRGLIKPGLGMAVAYIDYSSQEVAVAAALSCDPFLIDAVASGDTYMSFAVRAGLAPDGATSRPPYRARHQQSLPVGDKLRDGGQDTGVPHRHLGPRS